MSDVLCLGEVLVDWVSTAVGFELDKAQTFTKAPGGAPANTAVGVARQGISTAFIGRVSDDEFGHWLKASLEAEGIDVSLTIVDPDAQTRMAYVVTTARGDRKLAEFTKIACADARLEESDLENEFFAKAAAFHFGSISMICNPADRATQRGVELAKENNLLVSYDPNVRLGLWPSPDACKRKILDTLAWADLVKINEDELSFLTGSKEIFAADALRKEHNIPLLIVTLDSRGAFFSCENGSRTVPGFEIKLLEATGAGDGFNSGVLSGLLATLKNERNRRESLKSLPVDAIAQIVRRANAIGAMTCTKPGAIPALPTFSEVEHFLKSFSVQALS